MKNQQIKKYTLENDKYKISVLNIGAALYDFSINGHNICLQYNNIEDYRDNEICNGAVVGRTAGRIRIKDYTGWPIPTNYNNHDNCHGNSLHNRFYNVSVKENKIILKLHDSEGEFKGDANILITYELTSEGMKQTIEAHSNKPTLLNLTNHAYFNLNLGNSILDSNLKVCSDTVSVLDKDNFNIGEATVGNTAFDFRNARVLKEALIQYDTQFGYSKFLNHSYRANKPICFSTQEYRLDMTSSAPYVHIYSGSYLGQVKKELTENSNFDYAGICFEFQKIPGDVIEVEEYKIVTDYKLTKIL